MVVLLLVGHHNTLALLALLTPFLSLAFWYTLLLTISQM